MKYEDIKAGETYNVRVKVIGIAKDGVDAIYIDDDGIAGLHIGKRRVGILRPISPENAKKNTESTKYDPCRRFRKGDKVRLVPYRGRAPIMFGFNIFSIGEIFTVEELEPYFVMELKGAYGVYNTRFQPETEACHFFTDMHPHAKEAAEAECDRLNAAYRKEMEK